jgi:hypothetical protein
LLEGSGIDLSMATVLPGLIDGHNQVFKIGDCPGTGRGRTAFLHSAWNAVFHALCHAPGCQECAARPRIGLDHVAGLKDMSCGAFIKTVESIMNGETILPPELLATEMLDSRRM